MGSFLQCHTHSHNSMLIFSLLSFVLSIISVEADAFSWIRGGWNSFGLGSWAHQRSQYINPVAEPEPSFGRRFFDPRYRVPSAEPEPFSSIPLPEPEPEPEPVVRKFGRGFVKQSLVTTPNVIETPKPSPPSPQELRDEPLVDITPAFRSLEDNLFSE